MEPHLISIVDDDASVRRAIGRLLRAHGFVVEGFGAAEEFLVSLRIRQPACILVDLHMPGMGGLELLEALQRMHVLIPTIVVTADCSPANVSRAMTFGARDCLRKPVEPSLLVDAISGNLQ